jgi:hypothetical protein
MDSGQTLLTPTAMPPLSTRNFISAPHFRFLRLSGKLRMKTRSVAASFSSSFFPNAGISPLIPLRIANLIRWSVSLSVISLRLGFAFPVTSPTWQRAQLRANNFAPTAAFGFWLAMLSAGDRIGNFKVLDRTMRAGPSNPPITLTEISKAAISAFTSVFTCEPKG